jgi:hypothetical protein
MISKPSFRCIIATLIAGHLCTNLTAQEIPIDILTRVNAVDYIFEGRVIKSTPYSTSNGRFVHTSNTIQVLKVLKGDISCGTIELITDGGKTDDLWVDPSHSLDLNEGCAGIFLAKGTDKELSPVDFYPESNYQKIEATFEDQSFIKYWYDGVDWRASDMWQYFGDVELARQLAEQVVGFNFVDCATPLAPQPWDVPATVNTDQQRTALRTDMDMIRQRMAEVAAKRMEMELEGRGSAMGEVSYAMTNIEVTGTDPMYLEFDITMHDDMGDKYLYWAGPRIVYDTLVFGSSIGQTTNIDVINAGLIADPNCYGFSYPLDLEANSFVAFAYPAFQSQCLAVVPTTPVQIFHIRMRVLDCIPSTLTMADAPISEGPSAVLYYSGWSETAEQGDVFDYASADLGQVEELEGCGPMITSFNPTTVAGGILQVLEIHGHGFGDTRGAGTVFFKNADTGGSSEVACDASDFLIGGWSDDLIYLYVPSADTALVGSLTTPYATAGTGTFRVVTDGGISIPSPEPLTIVHSVSSYPGLYPKPPARLGPWSVFEGRYLFHIDSLVAAYEDGAMIPVIRKALREWTCLTGVDWAIAEDSLYQALPVAERDSVCVINFGSLAPGVVAQAQPYPVICDGKYYYLESDLTLNSDPGFMWFMDTVPTNPIPDGHTDLYFVLLHELGHAHGLEHVLDTNAILYFEDNSDGPFRKIQLYGDFAAHTGGNWVMDASFSGPPSSGCTFPSAVSITSAPLCDGFFSIMEVGQNTDLRIQPNPFNRSFDILSLEKNILTVEVFNSIGALVYQAEEVHAMNRSVDLGFVNDGFFSVLVSFDNGTSVVVRIVKAG